MIETLKKPEMEISYVSIIQALREKPIFYVSLNVGQKAESPSSMIRNQARMPISSPLSPIVLEQFDMKRNKRHPNKKGRSKIVSVCRFGFGDVILYRNTLKTLLKKNC